MLSLNIFLFALTQEFGSAWTREEVVTGVIRLSTGIAIAAVVYRFVCLNPWPRPFRLRFAATHLIAGPAFGLAWHLIASSIEAVASGRPILSMIGDHLDERMVIAGFMYMLVAGISYSVDGAGRAARAEAISARTQLAALRAQLHPHFLFNALHTVVQLIPVEPARAAEAAELVAGLLRTTLEEQRDEVTLAQEWNFVSRYLAVERIRFGDRLILSEAIPANLLHDFVPAFALQTLIENAVRHGAAPSVAATEIVVSATGTSSELRVSVRNSGGDRGRNKAESGTGTGLARLRERMTVLYGSAGRLDCRPDSDGGFEAILVVPRRRGRES